jgi:phosphatidylglycerophosphate synthase
MNAPSASASRRPLRSRGTPWSLALARRLTAWRIRPNAISASSVVWTAAAGAALTLAPRSESALVAALAYVGAALGIQLRLLANLMDGMVAVEGGLGSKTGELWNDLPDRFADVLVFAGAGYGLPLIAHGHTLGWTSAVAAVITAYVRVLGVSGGAQQHFDGPMAKQQRMATMTVACLLAAVSVALDRLWPQLILAAALLLVMVGCAVTIGRRLQRIAAEMRQRP